MSANPAIYDGMTIYRGFPFTRTFTCKDSSGNLTDLSSYSGEFRGKAPRTTSNLFSYTTAPNIVLGGPAGTVTIFLDATATAALAVDEVVFTISRVNISGAEPIIIGNIPVSGDAF